MDELKAIRSFVKVVEAGSFAEAARQEGIAKSVITKRINQLETHMEMELLQRSTRRMSLTDTGANFYDVVSEIEEKLREAGFSDILIKYSYGRPGKISWKLS